ncbi:MAG: InlB B-repeat-containing protein [Candidatus Ornithomonoglobus sp.]
MIRKITAIISAAAIALSLAVPALADDEPTYATKTIHFDIAGGSGSTPADMTVTDDGSEYRLPVSSAGSFYKNGYDFLGWSTSNDAYIAYYTGYEYSYDELPADGTKLYAYWGETGIYLTVIAEPENGGTVVFQKEAYTQETGYDAVVYAKPKDGYAFEGFYKTDGTSLGKGESNQIGYDGEEDWYKYSFTITETTQLIARFEKLMTIGFQQAAAITEEDGTGTLRFIFEAGEGKTPDTFGAYVMAKSAEKIDDQKLVYTGENMIPGETFSVDVTDIPQNNMGDTFYAVPFITYGDTLIAFTVQTAVPNAEGVYIE